MGREKVSGRKRGLAADVLGLIIGVVVLAASAHDNTVGTALLDQAAERCGMRLENAGGGGLVGQVFGVGEAGVVVQGGVQAGVAGSGPVAPAFGTALGAVPSAPSGMRPSFLTSARMSSPGRERS